MPKKQAVNALQEGIKADQHPSNASQGAMSDALNNAIITGKGNELINQVVKSNRPYTSQYGIDLKASFEETITDIAGAFDDIDVDENKDQYQVYFELDSFIGQPDAYIEITFQYATGSPVDETFTIYQYNTLINTPIFLSINPNGQLTNIHWEIFNSSASFTIGVQYFSGAGTSGLPIGIPIGNKVLGVKTYNDIAYIISGRRSHNYIEKTRINNVSKIPFDDWDRSPAAYVDDGRDSLSADDIEIETSDAINGTFDIFQAYTRGVGSNTLENAAVRIRVGEATVAGVYQFRMSGRSQLDKYNNINEHYVKLKLSYRGKTTGNYVDLPGNVFSGYHINESGSVPLLLYNSNIIEADLTSVIGGGFPTEPDGVEFFIQGQVRVTDRGKIGINTDLSIETLNKPFNIITTSSVLFSVGSITAATTNYTPDGGFVVTNNDAVNIAVAIDYNAYILGIVPAGTVTFTNLPAGTYTVYAKASNYVAKQIITIPVNSTGTASTGNLPDLKLRTIITDYDRSVPGGEYIIFRWIVDDIGSPYTGNFIYKYKVPGGSVITEPITSGEVSHSALSIVQEDGLLRTIVEDETQEYTGPVPDWSITLTYGPKYNIGGGPLQYSLTQYESEYKRKVQVDIPIELVKLEDRDYITEIGSFPAPDYNLQEDSGDLIFAYRPLNNYENGSLITDKIHLSGTKYLDMEIQPSYDGTVNIIYTDDENLPRLVNSGFTVLPDKKFEIIDRIGARDTNRYTELNIEVSTRLIQNPAYQIIINPTAVRGSGGSLEVGMYKYFIKLGTLDENETDFLEETGYIPIFNGTDMGSIRGGVSGSSTEKAVELKLTNIDSSFAYVRLYLLINSGDNSNTALAYRIDQKYQIPTPSYGRQTVEMSIVHTGFEERVSIPVANLSEKRNVYETTKTIAQIDNRLFIGKLGQPDVDYKTLFELGRKIVVVPTLQNDYIKFNMLLEKWGVPSTADLRTYSQLYYNQSLDNLTLPDINKINPSLASNIFTIGFSQSHHNPLFVEKYSMYWPYETYPFRVCFILNDDSETYPVPIIGGDYSKYFIGVDTKITEDEIFSSSQGLYDGSSYSGLFNEEDTDNWVENTDWKTLHNKLGIIRFPKQKYGNAAFLPKFKFSLDDFEGIDPGVLAKIKGFFFVRAERKPDLVMEGVLSRCGLTTVSPIAFKDDADLVELPNPLDFPGSVLTAVPANYGLTYTVGPTYLWKMMFGYEVLDIAAKTIMGDPITSTILPSYLNVQKINYPFITGVTFEETAVANIRIKGSYIDSSKKYYKFWFKSGDIEADFPTAASIFNGSKYTFLSFSQPLGHLAGITLGVGTIPYSSILTGVHNPRTAIPPPINARTIDNHELVVLRPGSYPGNYPSGYSMIGLTDYVQEGSFARTGGGFASLIGYRSNLTIPDTSIALPIVNPENVTQLSGYYPTYIGVTVEDPSTPFPEWANLGSGIYSPEGYYSIYPSKNGPLTPEQLKTLYASDQGISFIAVTPRYLFEDFSKGNTNIITQNGGGNPVEKENIINIIGTRGDCYVNMNTFNIAKALPAISGDPTVEHPHLADDSGEYNSYRSGDASMTLQAPLRNNWLAYARHPEVIDEVEAALYNKARSFPPLYGAGDKYLGVTRGNKLPETSAFNKGYRAHFEGRKYIGVSHDVPFVRGSDENSIAFSEQYTRDSFYNGYRDFLGLNERSYKKEYGAITKLVEYGGQLVAVFQKGVALIGINDQTIVGQNSGGNVLVDNAQVMNPKGLPLSTFIGSDWIRSVLRTDNAVYGVDVENNKIWRINGTNLEIVSDNSISSILYGFLEGFRGRKEVPGELYIASFYDRTKKDVIFTFYNDSSRYTDIPLPMDPDVYYMLLDLGNEAARQQWVDDAIADPEEQLRRHNLKERFDLIQDEMDIHPSLQNHLTVVYNENTGTWTTRWNIAPEFMFNLGSKLYSINNEHLLSSLTADTRLDNYLTLFGDSTGTNPYELMIWEHESVTPDIPQWGSLYAQKSVYEVEFIINEESALRKVIDNILIEGPKSDPYSVIYQTTGEPQWLHYILDTTDPTGSFATWADMQQGYTDRIINAGIATVDPNAFILQTINPRDRYGILKANFDHYNGLNKIICGKDIDYMYILPSTRQKYRLSSIQDNYVKIRVRYNNGKFTAIKAIYTLFRVIN